jgi:hypothetical protein
LATIYIFGFILIDESGNGRDGICTNVTKKVTTGFGASYTSGIDCLSGSAANSTITLPANSLNITICFMTRYSGIKTERIITGSGSFNYLYGHYGYFTPNGKIGTIYDNNKFITQGYQANQSNWVSMCICRSTAVGNPNNVLFNNGIGATTAIGQPISSAPVIGNLGINTSQYGEVSDFEIAHLLIFDSAISAQNLVIISNAFDTYRATGILQ